MPIFVIVFYKEADGIKPLGEKEESITFVDWRRVHMSDLQKLTEELMQDPEFKKEYEALQPEMDTTRAILNARIRAGITQSTPH